MASSKVTVVLLARADAVFAFAGLGFVAVADVNFFATFFAMAPSANAGRPNDGEE
jgi:hypothetical protein